MFNGVMKNHTQGKEYLVHQIFKRNVYHTIVKTIARIQADCMNVYKTMNK